MRRKGVTQALNAIFATFAILLIIGIFYFGLIIHKITEQDNQIKAAFQKADSDKIFADWIEQNPDIFKEDEDDISISMQRAMGYNYAPVCVKEESKIECTFTMLLTWNEKPYDRRTFIFINDRLVEFHLKSINQVMGTRKV